MTLTAKLAAALVLVLTLISAGWYLYNAGNRNGTNAVLVKTQADSLKAWQDSAAEMAIDLDNQRAINRRVSNEHQKELAAARDYKPAAAGLRLPATVCNQAAGQTETASAGGSDGATAGTIALPENIGRDLRGTAKEADIVTSIARGLQNWARENGFYGPQIAVQTPVQEASTD